MQTEVEVVIARLRMANAQTLAALQVIADGAEIAGEQFQNKQIELIKNPPEMSFEQILCEVFMVVVLETLLVGNVSKAVTKFVKLAYIQRINNRTFAKLALGNVANRQADLARLMDAAAEKSSLARSNLAQRMDRIDPRPPHLRGQNDSFTHPAFKKTPKPTAQSPEQAAILLADAEVASIRKEINSLNMEMKLAEKEIGKSGGSSSFAAAGEPSVTDVVAGYVTGAMKAAKAVNLGDNPAEDKQENKKQEEKTHRTSVSTDTRTVNIIRAARSMVVRQRLHMEQEAALIEMGLRLGVLDPAVIGKQILDPAASGDLDMITAFAARVFEGHLWANFLMKYEWHFMTPHEDLPELKFGRIDMFIPQSITFYLAWRLHSTRHGESEIIALMKPWAAANLKLKSEGKVTEDTRYHVGNVLLDYYRQGEKIPGADVGKMMGLKDSGKLEPKK